MHSVIFSLYFFYHFYQIIGRVYADPEILPRSFDFSLNVEAFKEKFCKDCPDSLLKLAVICSQIAPDSRYAGFYKLVFDISIM